jgi:hypothetical protein
VGWFSERTKKAYFASQTIKDDSKGQSRLSHGHDLPQVSALLLHVIHRKLFNHDGPTRKKSITAFLSFRPQGEI